MIKVGIVGANGYTGLELIKLLSGHNKVELTTAVSRSNAGTEIAAMYPSLRPYVKNMLFSDVNVDEIASKCDVVFTALPHAASADIGGKLLDKGVKIIDLSADFRYNDLALYEKTYKVTHPRPELNAEAVYGLTEINRNKIKGARIVGNPGCYTTTALLALLPLIRGGVISPDGIIIDAKSGTTGAGRKSEVDYGFCEVTENFKAYGITTHRHTSEIEEHLSSDSQKVTLSFTPHLLPVKRGILETIYAQTKCSAAEITNAYNKFYVNERFVEVSSEGVIPELKWVVGSNMCCIGFKMDVRLGRVIIVSCTDNLLKGASGQAVQNMNVMLSFEEDEGLKTLGRYL